MNHIGASLCDIRMHAYEVRQSGARMTLEFMAVPARHDLENLHVFVISFASALRNSACVDQLIPPSGQTRQQYVMHLLALAERVEAIGRRYVVWESGNAGLGYASVDTYVTKEESKIENILEADRQVRRELSHELHYLKQLEAVVLARPSSAN